MTTLYLVRHGETNGNLGEQFQGITDNPLNDTGHRQGQAVGEAMKDYPIDVIYSSPLKRALETAFCIAKHHNLVPIVEDGLREINGGLMEGKRMDYLMEAYPDCVNNMMNHPALVQCPEGESMRQVSDRVSQAISRIVQANRDRTIVVTSHGCAISTYLHYASGKPFEEMPRLIVTNTAISKITFGEDLIPHLEYSNDHAHLQEGNFIQTDDVNRLFDNE